MEEKKESVGSDEVINAIEKGSLGKKVLNRVFRERGEGTTDFIDKIFLSLLFYDNLHFLFSLLSKISNFPNF